MKMFAHVESAMIVLDDTVEASGVAHVVRRMVADDIEWTVLAVTEEHPSITSGATGFAAPVLSPDEMEERSQAVRVGADAAAAATARALGDRPVRQLVERGDVLAAVQRVSDEYSFDLVVAGSVDLGEHLTDGDVPFVLTVPSADGGDPGGPVLVAVDHSPLDEYVVDSVLSLLGPATKFLVLQLTPTVPSGASTTASETVEVSAPDDSDDTLAGDAEVSTRRWADRLGARDVTPIGGGGDPASRILDAADEHGAAMIVLGSRDRSRLSTLFRQSLSSDVRRQTERPVLVLR